MKAALPLLALLVACGAPQAGPPPFAAPHASELTTARTPAALAARLPQRPDLVCFPCHSQLKFEKGPPFAHAASHHRNAGHCHVCHTGAGHEGRVIDRTACLTCHAEEAEELRILSRR